MLVLLVVLCLKEPPRATARTIRPCQDARVAMRAIFVVDCNGDRRDSGSGKTEAPVGVIQDHPRSQYRPAPAGTLGGEARVQLGNHRDVVAALVRCVVRGLQRGLPVAGVDGHADGQRRLVSRTAEPQTRHFLELALGSEMLHTHQREAMRGVFPVPSLEARIVAA